MKRKMITIVKFILLGLILASALWCLFYASKKMERGQQAEGLKQLESSLRKAAVTCYATEGVYPPTVKYLEENYGIQIDENKYAVFYEIFGDNIMPKITVVEQ